MLFYKFKDTVCKEEIDLLILKEERRNWIDIAILSSYYHACSRMSLVTNLSNLSLNLT